MSCTKKSLVRDNDITVDLISEENLENNSLCEKVNDDDETMQLGNGDILIVQPAVTDEMEDTLKFPNVRSSSILGTITKSCCVAN